MKTYLLGKEEVLGYLADFLERIDRLQPVVWCPVTESGVTLLEEIWSIRQLIKIDTLPINKKPNGTLVFEDANPERIRGKPVLLFDGAVHSGQTMSTCADMVLKSSPSEILSYALVVNRCSEFIPTFWGMMIDKTDRAYFLLSKIPNNRLSTGKNLQLPVQIRRLNRQHLSQAPIKSGVASIDRMTLGDRLFQMDAVGRNTCSTYILERQGKIVGFLTVHWLGSDSLVIDEIVVDKNHHKKGYGSILLRLADTLARQSDCRFVRLNAIETRIEWYQGFGYEPSPGKRPLVLDSEKYIPMERQVLYHIDPLTEEINVLAS